MLHVSALLSHHQAYTSRTTVFQFCLTEKQYFLKCMLDDGSKEPKHVAY